MFAGLLRLDLNDEPLKEWVTRTVEASGITEEDVGGGGMASSEEESPQQIEIEWGHCPLVCLPLCMYELFM